jgi:hypothetical protein
VRIPPAATIGGLRAGSAPPVAAQATGGEARGRQLRATGAALRALRAALAALAALAT